MTIRAHVEMVGRGLARKFFPRISMQSLDYDPYDKIACESRANALLEQLQNGPRVGALEMCRRILAIIGASYPTEKLTAEYFSNLEILLGGMRRLETPGQIVIGLGPGRCGSTSLAALLGTVRNSCCTHESPPAIFWNPFNEQVEFHIKRFRMLAEYHSLVADVSHWWLNSIEQIFDHFPEAKAIGLIRDPDDCVMSFMRVQGFGKGSYNPWTAHENGFWRSGHWDPTYPSFPTPSYANKSPDRAKRELITRYVNEYNSLLEKMAQNAPERIKVVRTEELGSGNIQEEIFQIAKARGETLTRRFNVNKTSDGIGLQIKL